MKKKNAVKKALKYLLFLIIPFIIFIVSAVVLMVLSNSNSFGTFWNTVIIFAVFLIYFLVFLKTQPCRKIILPFSFAFIPFVSFIFGVIDAAGRELFFGLAKISFLYFALPWIIISGVTLFITWYRKKREE